MTAEATIRSDLVTLLKTVSGIRNVVEEWPVTFDKTEALRLTMHKNRVHVWRIHMDQANPAAGLGYHELQHRARIEGFLGLAEDEPADGRQSREKAAELIRGVVNVLRDRLSALPTGACDLESVVPERIVPATFAVDNEQHPCLRMVVTATYWETVNV